MATEDGQFPSHRGVVSGEVEMKRRGVKRGVENANGHPHERK